MNESKQIDVNSASIIDLKAELYRKQEDFKLKKLAQSQQQTVENDNKLYEINNKQVKYKLGKRIREKNDQEITDNIKRKYGLKTKEDEVKNEELIEVEKALQKSRQMLEIKSKLYDKWSRNPNLLVKDDDQLEEDGDQRILVDFHRKSYDDRLVRNSCDKRLDSDDDEKDAEEWTEFVDSLGRTRKCLKKDFEHFQEMDRKSFNATDRRDSRIEWNRDVSGTSLPHLSADNQMLTNDLRRELERQKWEDNAKNEVMAGRPENSSNNLNTHYQDVQHNEIRDHGVAYYAFAKDQTTRNEQMELLKQLRDQTKTRKEQKLKLKQRRKELLKQRLAKVAQRKGIAFEPKESSSESEEEFQEILTREAEERPIPTSVREWDVGKEDLPKGLPHFEDKPKQSSHKNYIEERREERINEFAPPMTYQKTKSHHFEDKRQQISHRNYIRNRHEERINEFAPPMTYQKTKPPYFEDKRQQSSHENYIQERHEERINEFAPPMTYEKTNNWRVGESYSDRIETDSHVEYEPPKDDNLNNHLNNNDECVEKNESGVERESNPERQDINELIGNALSYFRNNLNQS